MEGHKEEQLKVIGIAEQIKIDEDLARDIKMQLLKEMDSCQLPLQFENYKFITAGFVEFNCGNKETVEWLLKQDNIFAYFNKMFKHKIGFYKITEYKTVSLALQNYIFRFDTIKNRLEQQNPGLKTNQWRVIKERIYINLSKEEEKQFLFEIDYDSYKYLEDHNWTLHLQFGKVPIRTVDLNSIKASPSRSSLKKKSSESMTPIVFTKEDIKGRVFLKDIVNDYQMHRYQVIPFRYTSIILSP